VTGSFDRALEALRNAGKYGLTTSVNTQITSQVRPQLAEMQELFIDAGARHWQVQLTVAMGRAADHPELLLQPYELLELMPLLADLYKKGVDRGFLMQPGNNIGYFGPYESLWRGSGDERVHWSGCNAGQNTVGIEADGTIKGCPSLPTSAYAGGNIRDLTAQQIWTESAEIAFTRDRTVDDLWGFCRSCYYADVCRAGCTWTTHTLFGRPGNNPYCHHRALELAARGLRERIVQVEAPPGLPFDHGKFALVVEGVDGGAAPASEGSPGVGVPLAGGGNDLIALMSGVRRKPEGNGPVRKPQKLQLCRGCDQHVTQGTTTCPHCGGDVKSLRLAYNNTMRRARRAEKRLSELLNIQ
jgi:radical SAM protein with 4Fe4S-binding SPASM domain